ncbi:hypothetical protein KL86CLO1_12684 [uncultured Eubacteriales bacterium]|uniref:Uncharacterized protein n=1 Tax=uncultured Eubacteriales bacterium TaxID=172733 RepID=A0A212KD42_9FIRM|nr:hypothetical protein KL86CLO1_12684 [uncultured Eubacteriales bacterium]
MIDFALLRFYNNNISNNRTTNK